MFFPKRHRTLNLLGCFTGTHFPNPGAFARQQRHQIKKIYVSRKRRLMILGRPDAILNMTAKGARTDLPQPFSVIEKLKIRLDLDMTKVVPISDLRRLQFLEEGGYLSFRRNLLVAAPSFDAELYLFWGGRFHNPAKTILHPSKISRCRGFPLFDCAKFFSDIFSGEQFPFFCHGNERIGNGMHFDFTQMQNNERSAETFGEVDGLQGLLESAFAFGCAGRGKLIAIGRCAQDLHRQRAEIMQAAEFDTAIIEHLLNSRHQRNSNSMAELDAVKPELNDFA